MVGVCATLLCMTVDVVLDWIPAVVCVLMVCWDWLGDNLRLAPGLTSAGHLRTEREFYSLIFKLIWRSRTLKFMFIFKKRVLLQYKAEPRVVLVLDDVVCGFGRCAILFFSPEKPGLELCEDALTVAES